MENYVEAKNKCSLTTQHWLETASPAEITAAIEIGCMAVSRGKVFAANAPTAFLRGSDTGIAVGTTSGPTSNFDCVFDPECIRDPGCIQDPGCIRDVADPGLDNKYRPQPAIRGQIGEDYVESILKRHFTVENVSRSPKSGDLSVMLACHKIVVEVKNYTSSVPTIGVEKFRRDLCTTAASGGVFISLQSPIMRVTNDFTVMYEPVDERVIPCAYLVGNSENAIIVAINMVISLIESHDYINSAIRECGVATTAAYDLVEKTGQLARVRQQMQIASVGFSEQITKSMSSIASAENGLREITAVLRDTTPLAAPTDISTARAELEKLHAFARLPAILRGYIIMVMKQISRETGGASSVPFAISPTRRGFVSLTQSMLTPAPWLITAKKCTHVRTGVCIALFAGRADILIPRAGLTNKVIFRIVYTENIVVSVDRSTVTIGITESSLELIMELFTRAREEPIVTPHDAPVELCSQEVSIKPPKLIIREDAPGDVPGDAPADTTRELGPSAPHTEQKIVLEAVTPIVTDFINHIDSINSIDMPTDEQIASFLDSI